MMLRLVLCFACFCLRHCTTSVTLLERKSSIFFCLLQHDRGNLLVKSFYVVPLLYVCWFFNRFRFSVRATNTIWPPLSKAAAENTISLLPSFSDRPPLSWQHAMAQHLLGFSWMASDCISCVGIRSPLSPQTSSPP